MIIVTFPSSVLNCLKNEMQIEMDHFFKKYDSFNDRFKATANGLLINMLIASKTSSSFSKDVTFYEDGTHKQNEFINAMFSCFEQLNISKKLDAYKGIYEHEKRGKSGWFPIVVIPSPVDDYSEQPAEITVYRGCSLKSFKDNSYRNRQSWTTDFDTAKEFAFNRYGFDKEDRVVITTTVSNSDIFWMRAGEREVVLNPRFTPLSDVIKLDYEQCNRDGQI